MFKFTLLISTVTVSTVTKRAIFSLASSPLKPSNPAAQKAVLESLASKYKVSPAVPNAVKAEPIVGYLSKKSLFKGLEEYDASLKESFTLKPSPKLLILKPKNTSTQLLTESN